MGGIRKAQFLKEKDAIVLLKLTKTAYYRR